MSAFLNQSYDDRLTNVFIYQGSWSTGVGTWNASNVGESGTLASTNDLNANVTFTFPVPAVAFYYYGIRRSHGGSYGICVDCDPNNPVFIPVDGFNATDDGKNPPVVLYSQTFSTAGVHEIIMRNQADPRGTPAGNSQLTLDRVDLEVVNPNAQPTVTLTDSPTSPPTTTNTGGASATTTATHSSGAPIGAIIGAVLGVLAVLIAITILWCWLRLRRKHARAATFNPDPLTTSRPDMHQRGGNSSEPYTSPTTTTPLTTPSSQWGYGAGKIPSRPTHQPMLPSVTSSFASSSSPPPPPSSSRSGASSSLGAVRGPVSGQRRREQDAGPIAVEQEEDEEADEEGTLPPAYGQVFSVGRRSSRRTLPPPPPQPGKVALGTVEEGSGDRRR